MPPRSGSRELCRLKGLRLTGAWHPSIPGLQPPTACRTGIRPFQWTCLVSGPRTRRTGSNIERHRRRSSSSNAAASCGRPDTARRRRSGSMCTPVPTTAAAASRLRNAMRPALQPRDAGLTMSAARRDALAASTGATDFGAYFTYFSFFIVASALLLALLFFRLGIEQRLRQIGILRASGFTIAQVRALLISEALVLAAIGSALGALGALGYGWLMVYGLRTWWVGAVGTTRLALHPSWLSLVIGALAGLATAAVCVAMSLRSVARLSPRTLLHAQAIESDRSHSTPSRRMASVKWACAAAAAVMLGAGFTGIGNRVALFFGAAALLLTAAMCQFSSSLRSRESVPLTGRGRRPLWRLGFRSAAFRPSRSVLSAALIASAAFIIVSVDAFRRGDTFSTDLHSGTGGFALLAQSQVPILASPNDAAGREALVVNAPDFSRIHFTRFRVRPGQDASCLNLYRPTTPTIIAPEAGFIERGRFAFAGSIADDRCRACESLAAASPSGDGRDSRHCRRHVARVRAARQRWRHLLDGHWNRSRRLSSGLSAP